MPRHVSPDPLGHHATGKSYERFPGLTATSGLHQHIGCKQGGRGRSRSADGEDVTDRVEQRFRLLPKHNANCITDFFK